MRDIERKREYDRQYKQSRKEQGLEYARNYRRMYYQEHKEEILSYQKTRPHAPYEPHPRKQQRRTKQETLEATREWHKQSRKSNPVYKLRMNLSTALWKALNGKRPGKTFDILGYTKEAYADHIQALLDSVNYICPRCGVSDIHEGFQVDHAIPICTAETEEEIIALFALTNLQPLCPQCNLDKHCENDVGVYYYPA